MVVAVAFLVFQADVVVVGRAPRSWKGGLGLVRRSLNETVVLHVPATMVRAKSAAYLSRGKAACRNPMIREANYNIVGRFGAEYRGVVQYYLLAGDVQRRTGYAGSSRVARIGGIPLKRQKTAVLTDRSSNRPI